MNDAFRLLPFANVLYGCDARWWRERDGCPSFAGEKWSCHNLSKSVDDDKREVAEQYGLNLILGQDGNRFSLEPDLICYGSNSGFQAVNLAMQFGATFIVLVGFDMRKVDGKRHFFGDYEKPLRNTQDYTGFRDAFAKAAKKLPGHIQIVNATPASALTCFPMVDLHEALAPATT